MPEDADDVVALVKWAGESRTPLIPRGSGSGMAGGAIGPGVIADLSRLEKSLRVDRGSKRVQADPGVICKSIDAAAREAGLRFPVDPSSAAFCTIGGMVSTNAAGAHSLKFGATRRWVRSLDCVFSDGSRATVARGRPLPTIPPIAEFLRRLPKIRKLWASAADDHALLRKDSSGYAIGRYLETNDLLDLLAGSEGTLCVIVGVELDLIESPAHTTSLMAAFSSLENAARGAQAAREAGASACELLDKSFLDLAATAPESTADSRARAAESAAILLIELEADDVGEGNAAAIRLRTILRGIGAETVEIALTPDSEKGVWELRHAASPILSRLKSAISMQFIEDSVVPPERLVEYVLGVRSALERRSVDGVIFGHAGDAHVHVNPLIDVSATDWKQTVSALLEDVVDLTARLGGSLCGEHGDGRLRTPLMNRVWSDEAMKAFAEVKQAFDPDGILNPGVKVPLAGQEPLGANKYDPALPRLAGGAREILDELIARRGYSDFRLSLIGGVS